MLYGNLRTVLLLIRCLIIAVTVTVFWDLGSGMILIAANARFLGMWLPTLLQKQKTTIPNPLRYIIKSARN